MDWQNIHGGLGPHASRSKSKLAWLHFSQSHDGSMYAIYGNMDPINIPQMLAYIPYMDPMGYKQNNTKQKQITSKPARNRQNCLVSLSAFILLEQMNFLKTSAPIAQRSPRSGSPGGSIVDGKAGPHLGAPKIAGCFQRMLSINHTRWCPRSIANLVYNSNIW